MTLAANMGGPMQMEALEGLVRALEADLAQAAVEKTELEAQLQNARNDVINEIAQRLRAWADDLRSQSTRSAIPGADAAIMAQATRLSLAAADIAKMVTEAPAPVSEDRLEMIL